MKYNVKYEVRMDNKSFINPGIADFDSNTELNAGQLKSNVKEWLEVGNQPVISEVLKSKNKELKDTDMVPFSGVTGLSYLLTLSGLTGVQSTSGNTKSSRFFNK